MRREFSPRTVVQTPPAALLWEAQMLCWLAFGEHEALERDMKGAGILIPAQGIPTSTARIFPTESRANTLCRPSMGGSNALLAYKRFEAGRNFDRCTRRKAVLQAAKGRPTEEHGFKDHVSVTINQ